MALNSSSTNAQGQPDRGVGRIGAHSGGNIEAAAFSRAKGTTRYDRSVQSRRRQRTIIGVVLGVIVAAVAIAVIAAAAGFGFANSVGARLTEQYDNDARLQAVLEDQRRTAVELQSNWTDTSPFYMLLLGVDSDASRMEGDEAYLYGDDDSYYRTDTIILARIDPGNKKVALVSIHRDTWLAIDGVEQKINNAYSLGGVAKTIEVVSDFAGVPISHYAQVNIDGFVQVIDSLGGLDVTVPLEVHDPEYTGLNLAAGEQHMDGYTAMLYARARHAYDDLGDGDRYRAAAQRQIISLLLQRVMSATPVDMVGLINTMAGYVNTDLSLDQIVNLALAMRGIDVNTDVYTTMNPTISEYADDTWYEISYDAAWWRMMQTIDAGGVPEADEYVPEGLGTIDGNQTLAQANTPEARTLILVKDATGDPARASDVAALLGEMGWQLVTDGGEANIYRDGRTVVVYDEASGTADRAAQIAGQLGCDVEEVDYTWVLPEGTDVMIVTGSGSY